MAHLTYLIVLLPLVGFAVQVLFGRRLGDPEAGVVATIFVAASFVVSVMVFFGLLHVNAPVRSYTQTLWTFLPVGGSSRQRGLHRRPAVDDHGAVHHRHQHAHPPVLHLVHEGRSGLPQVLLVHEPVRRLDADPGARVEHVDHLRRLGRSGRLFVLAHLVLVHPGLGRQRRQEGLHLQPDRRRRLPPGHVPHLREGGLAQLPVVFSHLSRDRSRQHHRHHLAAVPRRSRQVGADPVVPVAG